MFAMTLAVGVAGFVEDSADGPPESCIGAWLLIGADGAAMGSGREVLD
jgi:hypothetical protein